MKSIILISISLCLFLVSCSKVTNSEPELPPNISISVKTQPSLEFFITNNTDEILYFDLTKTYFEIYDDVEWKSTSDEIICYTNLGFTLDVQPFSTIPAISTEESTNLASGRKYRIVYTFFRNKKLEGPAEIVSGEFEI